MCLGQKNYLSDKLQLHIEIPTAGTYAVRPKEITVKIFPGCEIVQCICGCTSTQSSAQRPVLYGETRLSTSASRVYVDFPLHHICTLPVPHIYASQSPKYKALGDFPTYYGADTSVNIIRFARLHGIYMDTYRNRVVGDLPGIGWKRSVRLIPRPFRLNVYCIRGGRCCNHKHIATRVAFKRSSEEIL